MNVAEINIARPFHDALSQQARALVDELIEAAGEDLFI